MVAEECVSAEFSSACVSSLRLIVRSAFMRPRCRSSQCTRRTRTWLKLEPTQDVLKSAAFVEGGEKTREKKEEGGVLWLLEFDGGDVDKGPGP